MEKKVESEFRDGCKALGCRVVKFKDQAQTGGPDRQVLIPGGISVFVELKDAGEVPRRDQIQYMIGLNRLGFLAFWADSATEALTVIEFAIGNINNRLAINQLIERQISLLKRRI